MTCSIRLGTLLQVWVFRCVLSVAAVHGLSTTVTPPPPPLAKTVDHLDLAREAMRYIDAGTDPFHVVHESIKLLQTAGFVELPEGQAFFPHIRAGGRYYYTRNRSTLVAFSVGMSAKPEIPPGFKVIGCHTDSPNLRVKPRSKRSNAGCSQIGVECYGGGMFLPWSCIEFVSLSSRHLLLALSVG